MQKTLSTLDKEESKKIAEIILYDIADQIQTIQSYINVEEDEAVDFISMLRNIIDEHSDHAIELLAFLLGIKNEDAYLHIQEIIDEALNTE